MRILADSKILYCREFFSPFGEVVLRPTAEITPIHVADADALLVRSESRVGEELLRGSRVRFVGTATAGTDHVDTGYLRKNGITFADAPGSNADSVAEYVLAALLHTLSDSGSLSEPVTVGIVGVGNVGRRVSAIARVLGIEVLENDPPRQLAEGGTSFVELSEIMHADFVTIHVPLTRDGPFATTGLFDGRRIAMMKPGSVIINTSRGPVVEGSSLLRALAERRLGAAVLDVWEGEPDINHELLSRVTLGTPHIAGYSYDAKVNASRMLVRALSAHLGTPREPAPVPPGPVRHMEASDASRASMASIVRASYDITEDDRNLRESLDLPPEDRPAYFRALRATYRTRREFPTVRVHCPDAATADVYRRLRFDAVVDGR